MVSLRVHHNFWKEGGGARFRGGRGERNRKPPDREWGERNRQLLMGCDKYQHDRSGHITINITIVAKLFGSICKLTK